MLASCSFHWRRRPRSEKPLLEHFGKVVSTMWNRVKNSRRSCSLALQPVVAIALLSELPDLRPGREERLHRTPDTNLSAMSRRLSVPSCRESSYGEAFAFAISDSC